VFSVLQAMQKGLELLADLVPLVPLAAP